MVKVTTFYSIAKSKIHHHMDCIGKLYTILFIYHNITQKNFDQFGNFFDYQFQYRV